MFDFFENSFERKVYRNLFVSPFSTRRRFTKLIDEEMERASRGEDAWMDIKLNNLVDAGMIEKLYAASKPGCGYAWSSEAFAPCARASKG